jgi:ADP-dependent NAD(P)H-hydrate dehydratase / NAD(P)H-hydrate epimerase
MKVVSPKQMSHIESQAYRDGASEADFMEEAGSGIALVVQDYVERHNLDKQAVLLCGKGNNGGDAYVTGVHLLHLDYNVFAYQAIPVSECSTLCKENYYRFLHDGGRIKEVDPSEEIIFPENGIIIDGLFGTGFHGQVQEPYSSLINMANNSRLPIIAVDIPSGLNGETGEIEGACIVAMETAFLGLPKTGFFLNEGWNVVGKLRYVDFGLPKEYIEQSDSDFLMLSSDMLKPHLPNIKRNRNKYQRGYVVGLAGSPGMSGAAILASTSALRGGAGIVRLLHPDCMLGELTTTPFEIIKVSYNENSIQEMIELMNKASATFVGPGLGKNESIKKLLKEIFPKLEKPSVIDADALTLFSEESVNFPKHSILTPHTGEMARLLNIKSLKSLDKTLLKTCQKFAENNEITLVLKGGPSFIFQSDQEIRVNPSGDPGMATAGAGDVLTGLIAALLSQGVVPHEAASLGVYMHGIAGEYAASEYTQNCMIASDIINYFPEGYRLYDL